jgi:hypothetical protein
MLARPFAKDMERTDMPRAYTRVKRTVRVPVSNGDGTCSLELTGGFVALIDEADAAKVACCSWQHHIGRRTRTAYAKGRPNGDGKFVRLHRFILGEYLQEIDHINLDTLDNRRSNLRIATGTQNNQNRNLYRNNTTGFKGVCRWQGLFVATICVNKKPVKLGMFTTAIAAANAYDAAARHYFGAFAATNASLGLLAQH